MNIKRGLFAFLFFFLIVNFLVAQNHTFPYELKKQDLLMLPLGIVLSEYAESRCENYDPITLDEIRSLNRSDVIFFDRSATYNWSFKWDERSDQYRDIVVTSTLFILSIPPIFHAKLSDMATVATMFIESYFFVKGFTYLSKTTFGRKRPFVYNTAMSIEERQAIEDEDVFFSFFSGHTAASFTAATFVSKVFTDIHGQSIWTKFLWGSSLSLAALSGYARYKSGMHYPSDVLVGAAVGFAIGYLIPTLHKKSKGNRMNIVVSPTRIGLSFQF